MLSKKSKYAIKALLYLARHAEEERVLISDIAHSETIPKKFLEAILLELKNAGILGSKKGKGGGYYLIKPTHEINLAEIIRLYDGAIALVPCAAYKYYEPCEECADENTCAIRNVFKELRDVTVGFLKANTLEEMLKREKKLLEMYSTPKTKATKKKVIPPV
jgi:Rrf2 family protein